MTTTRFTLLAAVALAGALAACTTSATSDPTPNTASLSASSELATTEASSAGLTTDSSTPASSSVTPSTTEAPASTGPPATTEAPSATETPTSPVDAFGLAGQDLADAQAAWDAYQAYRIFSAQAMTNPAADWSAQIASLMGTPADAAFQKSLSDFTKLQITVDDRTRADITKIDVKPDFIVFSACIDATESKSFDKDGKDVTAPDAPGSYKRHPGELWMERQNGVWRFVDSKNDFQTQC